MERQTEYDRIEKRAKKRKRVGNTVTYTLLTFWAVMVLFPFYWMVLSSLKSYSAYNGEYVPSFFTLSPTIQNYVDAFTTVPLARYFTNTLIFTVATTLLMLIVIVFSAFAFARLDFKGKNLVFTAFLALMMIPNELVIITNFQTITNLGMRNTFWGLILPSVTSVFYIYLLKENFEQVPEELYKAAKVDGTSDLKYLFKVMIPICQPTIVTIVILKVIECWNSYVWPRLNDMSTICPLNVKRDGKSDVMFHLENFLAAVRGEATLNAPADQVFASMVVAFGAIRSAARRETIYFKSSDFNL